MTLPAPLLFASLIVLGGIGGWLATRLRLPALFGQVLTGVALGLIPATRDALHYNQSAFEPFSLFALSLVAVTIGGHLEFRRLHNAKKRILIISVVQTLTVFFATFAVFHLLNPLRLEPRLTLPVHLLFASIATSTSPVSTVHLIKERHAKGLLVKTTLAVLAVSNLLTLVLFEIIRAVDTNLLAPGAFDLRIFLHAGEGILLAVLLGLASGWVLVHYCRHHLGRKGQRKYESSILQAELFTAFLVTIFFCNGLCEWITTHSPRQQIAPSPLLANMVMGLVLANQSSFKEDLLSLFNVMEHAVFILFYVLAGSHVRLDGLESVGWASLIFFAVRTLAKLAGGSLGGLLSGTTPRITRNIGPMMLSQGAIAVSLLVLLENYEVFDPVRSLFSTSVLTAVIAAELLSAPVISRVLRRSGETEKARTRLIEFLQEEFILPRVQVRSKHDALEQLVSFLCNTHTLDASREDVLHAILQREADLPTGIGRGIAVPHAKIGHTGEIVGVLGLLDPPVDFDAPDGQPVRLVILIATPETQAHRHLEVISAITRMLRDDSIRTRLFSAQSSEEIHEIIDSEEAETFNYFLHT